MGLLVPINISKPQMGIQFCFCFCFYFFLLERARRKKWSIAATHFIWYFPQQGACVSIIICTWTVSRMLPGRAWSTQHTPTMQILLEQRVGHFPESQALLHLFFVDGISIECPDVHQATLIYSFSPAFRHPEILNKNAERTVTCNWKFLKFLWTRYFLFITFLKRQQHNEELCWGYKR